MNLISWKTYVTIEKLTLPLLCSFSNTLRFKGIKLCTGRLLVFFYSCVTSLSNAVLMKRLDVSVPSLFWLYMLEQVRFILWGLIAYCIPDAKRGYYGFIIVRVRALVRVRVRRDFLLATYSPHFFPDFFHIWQVT